MPARKLEKNFQSSAYVGFCEAHIATASIRAVTIQAIIVTTTIDFLSLQFMRGSIFALSSMTMKFHLVMFTGKAESRKTSTSW